MPSTLKKLMVKEYTDMLRSVPNMVAVSYTGLRVEDTDRLRTELYGCGNKLVHVRNRIFKIALKDVGLEEFGRYVEGPTGVVVGKDIVGGIKVLNAFRKEFDGFTVRGGYVEGEVLTPEEVQELAVIPSREVLLARLAGAMQAPVVGVASVLQSVIRQLVLTVKEIEKSKEDETQS